MITITEKTACCGCGACMQVCPVNCIRMQPDDEGFLYPAINTERCVNCGACERACPVIQSKNASQAGTAEEKASGTSMPKAIGGWIKDEQIRYDSSSGGAFSLFARRILEQGGIVYGAAMDKDLTVRHIGIENEADLGRLRGSKYVQSDIGSCYTEIRTHLKNGRKVLFSGTPCQTAGLRSFLGKEDQKDLYILDFICHGVPSPLVFSRYMQHLSEKYGEPVADFRFRLKDKRWHPSGLQLGTGIETRSGKKIRLYPAFKDPFMNGFLDDTYLRPSCYDCAFKSLPKSYSDITIADFWGVKKTYPELCDGKGTSLVLLNSARGEALFDTVKEDFFYRETDPAKALRRNPSLTKSAVLKPRRQKFFEDLRQKPFEQVMRKHMSPFVWGWHKACSMAWGMIEKLIRTILSPILSVLHIKWDEKRWQAFFQFIRFAMVGVSNSLVSYTVNVCTLLLIRSIKSDLSYDYVIANITAFLVSVFWSWSWNSRKVFNAELSTTGEKIRSLLRTYASYALTGLGLNNLLSTFWIHVLGVSRFLSPLLNIPFTMPVNFFIIKKWAYKKSRKEK